MEGPYAQPVVDHVSLRVRDLEASRRFYEAALAPLGFGILYSDEGGCSFGLESTDRGADDFWILEGVTPSTGRLASTASTSPSSPVTGQR